jgi:hypothetical protein
MSLKLLQPGTQPLGQFDGYDAASLLLKGGEVVTIKGYPAAGTDKGAYDVFRDGYDNLNSVEHRPVVTLATASGDRPLFLADEGITGYGTLFGSVVGGTVGQQVTGGAVLGPHTATGSGKVTCWDKPGLYAVSLDACDTAASTGLQPTNVTLGIGAGLTYSSAGLLTPDGSPADAGGPVLARFLGFETNGSLVTTPSNLVQALNTTTKQFAFATFWFSPPAA